MPSQPSRPSRPKTSEILGRRANLGTAIAAAIGSYPPEKVVNAAKARYISRALRALRSRPDPSAPVLYYDQHSVLHTTALSDVKKLLLEIWAEEQDVYSGRVIALYNIPANMLARIRLILGFCFSGRHPVTSDPAREPSPLKLYGLEDVELHRPIVNDFLNYDLLPEGSVSFLDVASRHVCICISHRQIQCPLCAIPRLAVGLALPILQTWRTEGCRECRSQEWLCLKTPPRLNPQRIRPWRVSARQFVETL